MTIQKKQPNFDSKFELIGGKTALPTNNKIFNY